MDLMAGRAQWFLLIFLGFSSAWMDERPVLESRDGHLYISSAKDRNITLRIIGSGYVNVNEINLLHVASAAENATHLIERWRRGHIAQIEDRLQELTSSIEAIATAQKRGIAVDGSAETSSTPQPDRRKPGRGVTRNGMRGINDRMRRLEDRVRTIETKLRENECQSNPCQNGGSCQDLYEGYQCHCTSNWEGPNCMTDVNECVRLLGTDLGCQNGATCVNLPGSYRCDCAPGWFGLHCREKTSVCNVQTSEELCGHGVCVSKPGAPLGYTCICDQGWQSDGITPSCTRDVDECAGKHPPCSVNPMVACRNAPGTFFCDSCPRGYTGNGYYCTDIDECLMDNGGCSVNPRVQCMNTMGSRVCGPCPPGYRGDGVTCTYVGGCAINNGGCHPLAICVENPALSSAYVQCRCPAGYVGDGMGPNGCQPGTGPTMNSACATNPCVHGTCAPGPGNTFTCTCNPGFTGPTCVIRSDPCVPNPCKNSGTCLVSNGEVTCDCPSAYTGARCETPRQTCGGVSRNPVGHLEFPLGGQTYQHGLSCAWVLITNHSLVLNVTFTAFNLEHSTDCKFDFLQIHDGRNAGSHMIGRFCGDTLPNGSGNIISSHNTLYFWFHSDSSISHDGFKFHWNTIEPVCGGTLTDDYGTITSPGFPGRYPPNRDCFWTILVRNSRRIQFHFGQLMLEEHPTCDSDYVEITRADEERLGIYCNHTRPPPLITPGSEATIHFHSDGAGQDAGFQIHYATTEGTPGCSGVYTTHTGVISSPSHGSENSYQSSMECEWKIQLPPGERIKVTWSKFELESSVSCRFDYVEVFDGDNVDAPLIGRYCGTDLPPTIKSSGNSLVIIFETDYSIERGGFSLSYEVLCGGEFRDPTGILHSPLYPNNYHNLRTCRYEIIQPPERRIALSILDMDIEGISPSNCFFDSLEIYDGDSDSSPELATLCGDEEHIPSTPYYSTNNYMLLVFRTDGSITSRGFQANYTTIENKPISLLINVFQRGPSGIPKNTPSNFNTLMRCGGLIKEHHGTIRSPQDNLLYGSNEHCVWTLQAPPGYVIQLVWLSFNLEHHFKCRFDYVTIYEASPTSDRETHGTFCGTNLPPIVTSQSNTLTIEFRTDNSVTSEGFVLSYIFIDASRVCGGHYTRANGAIKSPNYPEPYPNSKECVWIIEAPNKHKVILNVHEFKLEGNSRCNFDYVEIRNGGYEMAPLIGKFCGTDIPSEIISHTNQLYIKFVSDESRSATGFSFEWDSATEGCGGTLTGATGDIMSPNYPQPYADNVDCQWKIVVAAGSLVQLVIIDLELEQNQKCRFDYVEISDGPGSRWNSQRYCSNSHPHIIQSKANMMTIRFRSDFSTSARGFHLKYETLCHNKLHGIYGVIESPNFPMKYPQNANCSWIIDAPLGNKINLTFSHFDLELANYMRDCRYDYVQVKEGELDTPNRVLGTYCNTDALPQKIHSTQHQVFVSFMTDSFNEFNGFRLEWAVDGCVGHLTKPSDSFTSPGYPNGYPINIDCEWVIEVDYTHSIELTFHEIQTEKHNECHFDKVEVFGGEDEQAPKLVEICYSEKPVTYTSPGNKMFVKLHSDMSYAGRGFSASYRSVAISCGGKFTADAGIIHSPNYPQNYPGKQNCEWLLEVDRNYIVNITFLDFDLENSRNCSDDYVRIYDGPTRDSPVLANHCQNELPPSYISSGNQMLVVMRTDSMVSAKGFKAAYSRACGARIVVKDSGYLIPAASPMGSLVPQHTNCTWILLAEDPADHVTLTFTHMDIDPSGVSTILGCSWAYLEIFEGEGIHGPSRGKWCNNVAPAPITSTGNAITVNLYAYYQAFGHFSIMYSSLNTACGGNYTSEHGTIASPGYPNSYPLNAECIWILNTSPGNRVTLSFSEFDIQQSENCDLDYLEIRENNGIGKLISVSCGTEIDTVTSSATLWIKFRSDGDGTGKGFRGEYSFLGGNELEGPMGRITSPLYPMLYRQSGTISWRILVEYGWNIRIEFTSLQIEKSGSTCMGSLKVYDGYDSDAPLLTEACGLMAPEPIVTSSNIIYIVLTADLVRIGNSFDLTWLQVAGNSGSGEEEIKISNCTTEVGLLGERNSTYTFNSPGWPYGYDSHLECTWIFTSPPGTHLVLRITSMNLEETTDCMADALLVYSGFALTSTKDATLMQRLCLSNATADVVETGNVMTVKFETDSYVNKTGFSAFVYRECGGKLTGPNGVIETYNITTVRGVRMWRLNCEWTVEVRPGRTIEVNITDMEITQGPSQTCTDNYLLLKNGIEVASPLLGTGKYCGNVLPASLETTGNRLFVKAVGTRPNVQFKLVYREKSMNCGGEFVLSSKQNEWEINTPNYPNIPHPYSECTWKVMAPAGERISIHFIERFDLSNTANCEREYVEIRDGSTDNSKLMGRFCKDTAPSSMTTSGNMMYIHFYTDVPEPKNGFKAVITSGEFCGGFVRGTSGVINSPNYPLSYPKNQNCSWWIIGPTDHTLKIQFRDFHLPGYYNCQQTDHVNIIEESPDNFTTHNVGTYCGNRKPDIIETWTNEVFVQFHSGTRTYMSFKGFSLNFTASQAVCGGELTAMSGIIKPDGYPVPRTHSRYCDWRITLPRGYQVVVDILDLDIVGTSSGSAASRPSYSLSFYNDFRYKSRIMVLGQGGTAQQIRSSGNLMMIRYRSSPGHRGFKLHYQGEAPAPCGGVITEANGTLSAPRERPFNESSFFCQWTIKPPERMVDAINDTGLTLAVKVTGLVGGISSHVNTRLCFYPQYISLSDVGMICGNLESPRYLRSPKTVNELTILNGTYGRPMHFHLEYEWQPCGGVLQGSSHTISAPRNIPFPINCAWFANYPDTGEMIKVAFSKLNIGSCDESYIIIRNGVAASPEIGKFCGNMKPPNIASISNQLWIEYFAVGGPNDFEFILQPVSTACGGALRGYSREISSPDFPRQYPNNAECTWEITAENGYHVGLTFVDRFSLETSASCDKDYVQVFDWVKAANNSDGTWKDIGRVCGRNTPRPFNSTSNHMKVTFHSNEAVRGDGFRALWSENCGGVFEVTEDINIIQSPGYPSYYRPNLFCNYTLLAPDKDITVEFTNFQLERSRGDCKFDNVTIITFDPNGYGPENEETIWCSNIKPPIMRSLGRMEIIFRTDQYIQRTGFQFRYSINGCGGRLTAPGEIRPLVRDGEYFGRMNCTWIIEAPADKRVVLRFEKFVIEYGYGCSYDKVAAYDDNWVNPEKILGSVCGNLTEYLPVFKSNSNSMVVTFTTDETRHAEGFAAKVLFVKSVAAGCGGTINLTATGRPYTFRTQKASTYESLEDCHWTVVAPPETNIRFTFNTMDLKNATNNATSVPKNECTGDYLEIHEGLGLYTPLLGRYCGNLIPMPVVSMTNALWIRFFSDGTIEGNGVTATLEALNTQCGPSVREIETTKQNLTSPRYPNPYEVGSLCRWLLRAPDTYSDIVRISFIDFDLPNSDRCEDDYLEISDKGNQHYVNEGFGENFIFSGKTDWPVRFEMASRQPMSSYKYCGSALPHEYYSYSNEVEVTFKANRGGHRGFKLEYGLPACNRNYTAEQGRIIHQGFTDCWITITAPVNRTISLYFNTFSLYDRQQCTENALQIRDGDINGNLLATLCGTETPSPIFSVSNKLTLHSWANQNTGYEKYDITYTTTSEGRGCGGRIYNYGGRFTSPLYPNMYRNNTVCTWDISVPRGFKVNLRFSVFDIGSKWNCANNNVKIYDVTPNNERLLRTTYCGDDDPAIFEAAGDRLIVEYTSTVNNMGTGWVASFMANPTAQPLPVVNF